jgi:hypothetical protein
MEDSTLLLTLISLGCTLLTTIILISQRLVGGKPLVKLIERYKKYPKFSELKFKIVGERTVVGKINDVNTELIPGIKGEGGMAFSLTIDISGKPYFNNHLNLKNAFGKQKFEQDGTKVIVSRWEPKIFNNGNFDKVVQKLQQLIDKIENKTSYNNKALMIRSTALVHWGRCWTEAPAAGISWILGGGAARFSAINRALFVGRVLVEHPLGTMKKQMAKFDIKPEEVGFVKPSFSVT